MAKWQFEIDLSKVWKEEDLPVFKVAECVVSEINKILPSIRKRKGIYEDLADDLEDNILPMFEEIVEMENEDAEDFDNALEYLYDWGDSALDESWAGKKMCWIKTVL